MKRLALRQAQGEAFFTTTAKLALILSLSTRKGGEANGEGGSAMADNGTP